MLSNKKILIGITGGIALYKACEVIRFLKKAGAEVKVVLSTGAEQFASSLLFSSLSGEKTYTNRDFFRVEGEISHIALARWPDLILILPATASFLAKLRVGQASELLLAVLLATKSPVILFPSMNTQMLNHPATQENLKILRSYGYYIYEPTEGELACGEVGKGRLPDPEEIIELLKAHFTSKNLLGKRVLITGGPTKEYIDDVRYITNASSGKTAYCLAKEAYYRGGEVYLLWGLESFPYILPNLSYAYSISYPKIFFTPTTEDMFRKAVEIFPHIDLAIFAAAPCDFKPVIKNTWKLKKKASLQIDFQLTPDIAKELSHYKAHQITVGFALEEKEKLERYAEIKKREKKFDIIIANPLGTAGAKSSEYLIMGPNFIKKFEDLAKEDLAKTLFDLIDSLF
ncbi:MAG: bifunctional phosphopantothenoylcysteine decarboxylase/phosphopantothenate--cysteine ligase CoaBC [Thermodesulfobacteriaceae bacterium]|nr:bifunctional phosphopantothenoylcysteine decarboxylase/phosphopantothenate--cysteine ligase CoaBC [Thermodesulfobacteriaceae bacterium]